MSSANQKPLEEYGSLLTVENAAEVLAVSKRTVYRLADKGELPSVKLGRRLYFPRAEMAKRLCLEH